jgi:hypothetical protein
MGHIAVRYKSQLRRGLSNVNRYRRKRQGRLVDSLSTGARQRSTVVPMFRKDVRSAASMEPLVLRSIYPVNTSTFGDLLIEVAIVEKLSAPGDPALTRAVAGPFKVKGHVTVEPGYTMQFDMLLKNVSSECACVATVRVVSARTIVDLDQ